MRRAGASTTMVAAHSVSRSGSSARLPLVCTSMAISAATSSRSARATRAAGARGHRGRGALGGSDYFFNFFLTMRPSSSCARCTCCCTRLWASSAVPSSTALPVPPVPHALVVAAADCSEPAAAHACAGDARSEPVAARSEPAAANSVVGDVGDASL